jgi:hypothetical protein
VAAAPGLLGSWVLTSQHSQWIPNVVLRYLFMTAQLQACRVTPFLDMLVSHGASPPRPTVLRVQAPAMRIRQCLSSGGCFRESHTPGHDFIDVNHWGGGVKNVLLGKSCKSRTQCGSRTGPRSVPLSMLNVTARLHHLQPLICTYQPSTP